MKPFGTDESAWFEVEWIGRPTLPLLRVIARFVLVWFAMWLASVAVWSFVAWALWLTFVW